MQITYGSVCSGIEAATVAWEPLGFKAEWFSEIDKFPSQVLAEKYPEVKNLGDMTKIPEMIKSGKAEAPEVLVGGTPCQSFSFSGKQEGLASSNGQLALTYCKLLDEIDAARARAGEPPAVCVWENVRGVLSDSGNAFGCFLSRLAGGSKPYDSGTRKPKCGGVTWRNAGYIDGPIRKIAWRVLDSSITRGELGSIPPQARRRVILVGAARSSGVDPRRVLSVQAKDNDNTEGTRRRAGKRYFGPITTVSAGNGNARGVVVIQGDRWRSLSPNEEEQRQGFPRGYTAIDGATDRQRYKAIGNSMAVNVMQFVGERIKNQLTN